MSLILSYITFIAAFVSLTTLFYVAASLSPSARLVLYTGILLLIARTLTQR